jgi:hypothetical protein
VSRIKRLDNSDLVQSDFGREAAANTIALREPAAALGDLPVRLVATTGVIVSPDELKAPDNAVAMTYAAHDPEEISNS